MKTTLLALIFTVTMIGCVTPCEHTEVPTLKDTVKSDSVIVIPADSAKVDSLKK